MKLFKTLFDREQEFRAPSKPVYAIGDIHGRCDLLERLIPKIAAHSGDEPSELIFLGDYIDRGPQSREVIDYLIHAPELAPFDCTFLMGNHEATLLQFLDTPGVGPSWSSFGGLETLLSYGVRPPTLQKTPDVWQEASDQLREALPQEHLDFLKGLELFAQREDYLFVHAGVDPDKPFEFQGEAEFLWIRDAFLASRRTLPWKIVHGHTPEPAPYSDRRRIGVDTGAYQTGVLTAACISAQGIEFLATP